MRVPPTVIDARPAYSKSTRVPPTVIGVRPAYSKSTHVPPTVNRRAFQPTANALEPKTVAPAKLVQPTLNSDRLLLLVLSINQSYSHTPRPPPRPHPPAYTPALTYISFTQ